MQGKRRRDGRGPPELIRARVGQGAGDHGTLAFITGTYRRADALLFGRRTYDLFSASWGAMDRGSDPIADHRGVGAAVRGEHNHLGGRLVAERLLEEIREGAMRWSRSAHQLGK
jgi:hypothetical protein